MAEVEDGDADSPIVTSLAPDGECCLVVSLRRQRVILGHNHVPKIVQEHCLEVGVVGPAHKTQGLLIERLRPISVPFVMCDHPEQVQRPRSVDLITDAARQCQPFLTIGNSLTVITLKTSK